MGVSVFSWLTFSSKYQSQNCCCVKNNGDFEEQSAKSKFTLSNNRAGVFNSRSNFKI